MQEEGPGANSHSQLHRHRKIQPARWKWHQLVSFIWPVSLQLKKRRKEFGEQLENYAKDLESYHTKAEIIKRDVISSEVGASS